MARVTGLEPAASGVTGQRSNQLSYTRQDVSGSLTMAYPSVNAENDCFHNFLQAPLKRFCNFNSKDELQAG